MRDQQIHGTAKNMKNVRHEWLLQPNRPAVGSALTCTHVYTYYTAGGMTKEVDL